MSDKESKLHRVASDEYHRQRININTLTNTSEWSEDDWEEFEDTYSEIKTERHTK
jgi:hypothetical protein